MSTRNKILWSVAVICSLIAVVLFTNASQKRNEIATIREEIVKVNDEIKPLEMIGDLYENFGKGTSTYHSKIPLIVLNRGGIKKNIPIYWRKDGTIFAKCSSNEISGEWVKKWDNKWTNYAVTSGNMRGCYQVAFTNKVDNDSFSVLVIVK